MKKIIHLSLATLLTASMSNAFAQKVPSKTKKSSTNAVAKEKMDDSGSNYFLDAMYHLKAGYETNDYNSINLTITDTGAEKLETKGVYAALGIEHDLTDFISTTTSPSFSMGTQSRPTYGNYGTNEVKTYAAKVCQSLNLNYGETNIFQPFIEAGIGYGWFNHTADWQSSNGSKFQSELNVEGMIFEIAIGFNYKIINGLMPFARFGIRKFTMEDETTATTSTPGAASEVAIDTQKEYGSATTVIGLGFEF